MLFIFFLFSCLTISLHASASQQAPEVTVLVTHVEPKTLRKDKTKIVAEKVPWDAIKISTNGKLFAWLKRDDRRGRNRDNLTYVPVKKDATKKFMFISAYRRKNNILYSRDRTGAETLIPKERTWAGGYGGYFSKPYYRQTSRKAAISPTALPSSVPSAPDENPSPRLPEGSPTESSEPAASVPSPPVASVVPLPSAPEYKPEHPPVYPDLATYQTPTANVNVFGPIILFQLHSSPKNPALLHIEQPDFNDIFSSIVASAHIDPVMQDAYIKQATANAQLLEADGLLEVEINGNLLQLPDARTEDGRNDQKKLVRRAFLGKSLVSPRIQEPPVVRAHHTGWLGASAGLGALALGSGIYAGRRVAQLFHLRSMISEMRAHPERFDQQQLKSALLQNRGSRWKLLGSSVVSIASLIGAIMAARRGWHAAVVTSH